MKYLLITLMALVSVNTAFAGSDKLGGTDAEVNWLCDYTEIKADKNGDAAVLCTPVGTAIEAAGNTAVLIPLEAFNQAAISSKKCGEKVKVAGHVVCAVTGFGKGFITGVFKTIFGIFE